MKRILIFAAALGVIFSHPLMADDWKNESGRGRGKDWEKRLKAEEKYWEQERKFREKERERAQKAWEEQRKAEERVREERQRWAERQRERFREERHFRYYDGGYSDDRFDPPGAPSRYERYDDGRWYGGARDLYDYRDYPYRDSRSHAPRAYHYEEGGYYDAHAYRDPPPYARGERYYYPDDRRYEDADRYYQPNRSAEAGARIGARIGGLIGGSQGAAIGADIGRDIGREIER